MPTRPTFHALGVNHQTAPVSLRERLAFDAGALPEALASLKALPGVEDVQVSLEGAAATVRHDPAKVSVEALRAAVEGAGFDSPA